MPSSLQVMFAKGKRLCGAEGTEDGAGGAGWWACGLQASVGQQQLSSGQAGVGHGRSSRAMGQWPGLMLLQLERELSQCRGGREGAQQVECKRASAELRGGQQKGNLPRDHCGPPPVNI